MKATRLKIFCFVSWHNASCLVFVLQCGLLFCSACKSKWHVNQTCDEVMAAGRKEDEGWVLHAHWKKPGHSTLHLHRCFKKIAACLCGTVLDVPCLLRSIPFSNVEDAEIKRCPLCHVPIERNDGCAQMMCKRCKHVFCWYCLASLDVSIVKNMDGVALDALRLGGFKGWVGCRNKLKLVGLQCSKDAQALELGLIQLPA